MSLPSWSSVHDLNSLGFGDVIHRGQHWFRYWVLSCKTLPESLFICCKLDTREWRIKTNFKSNKRHCIKEKTVFNVVCKMAAISSRYHCFNRRVVGVPLYFDWSLTCRTQITPTGHWIKWQHFQIHNSPWTLSTEVAILGHNKLNN